MNEDWRELAQRLRNNRDKNLKNYGLQNKESEKRIQELNDLQDSLDTVLKAGKGKH